MATKRKRKSVSPKAEADNRAEFEGLAKVAGKLKGWKPAGEVLTKVRAVPTIFPQFDRVTRCGGFPIERITLIHGRSNEGKTAFAHGVGLSFLEAMFFYGLVDAEYCYDAETEVLTRRGFVPWPDLQRGARLGCWDPVAGSLVYEEPIEVTRSQYRGRMFRVDNAGVDLLVTPAHKMFVKTRTDSGHNRGETLAAGTRKIGWTNWKLVPAEELDHKAAVRYRKHAVRTAIDDIDLELGKRGPIFPPHEDPRALLRLIGFFVGDGWVGAKRGRTNGICFTLRKKRKIDYLKELCLEVGWELSEMANHTFVVRAENVGRMFRAQFYEGRCKHIPEYLLDLNEGDASALLDGLRNSDGTAKRGAWEYSTSSEQVAQAVQRLVLHAGGAAHIGCSGVMFRVMVLSRMLEPITNDRGHRHTSWEEYDGEIFCAHTRTGILVVRRNGKPVLSGNTTPVTWLRNLMGTFADHPGFVAKRPTSYEETVDAVRELVEAVDAAKKPTKMDKKVVPPILGEETSALVVVDSIRKLVPANFLAKIAKEGATGKKGSVDGYQGRGAMLKAKLNGEWLDELTPMLYRTGTGLLIIGREVEKDGADEWDRRKEEDWKLTGGKALVYDSSLVARISRDDWLKDGKDGPVIGERFKVRIWKTKIGGKDHGYADAFFHTSNGVDHPEGFWRSRDVLDLAEMYDVITHAGGSWFKWGTFKKWNGRAAIVRWLDAHPVDLARLEGECRDRFEGDDLKRRVESIAEPSE